MPPVVESRHNISSFEHPDKHPWNRLAHRLLDNALVTVVPNHAGGQLLDIGCGVKPYRDLFAPYVQQHVGVDHPGSPHALDSVDVLSTAYDIPLPEASFDTILMSEVLEHLERPADALAECFRLLKPAAKIILSTPMIWTLHEEPRDFYRFTPSACRFLFEQAGFRVLEILPLGGQWTTLAHVQLRNRRRPAVGSPGLVRALQDASQTLGGWLNHLNFRPWLSHAHLAVAQKPE